LRPSARRNTTSVVSDFIPNVLVEVELDAVVDQTT